MSAATPHDWYRAERMTRLQTPLELEVADWEQLPRPWTFEFPWFRHWTVPRDAREELRDNLQSMGPEQFWDEIWARRDTDQGAVRVRSSGAWPWTAARQRELAEAALQTKPASRMKVIVGTGGQT